MSFTRAWTNAWPGAPPPVVASASPQTPGSWAVPAGIIRRKRPDVFLHTARLVADALPGARFVICAMARWRRRCARLAGTLGIADRVLFAGWQADLTPWYDAMDVLLFNSDFDAFGLTPAEAAARGVSVVASVRCGGLPELLRNGVDAFLLREHDPAALACAIHRLHEEPGVADDMRESLASRIREQHELARVLDFYTAWFNDAL
jgi:glycosyltransferase involved in cell wall biosynthesis